MQIKILFDKETKNNNLHVGWGVAFLVNGNVLFDTGEKGEWLISNMSMLGIEPDQLRAVVISHDHWDHTGGLWQLLEKKSGLTVYACPNFSVEFKAEVKRLKATLIEAEKFTEITRNIFVTGEIAGEYKGGYMPEQALVIRTKKGLILITGCSHPGIVRIVEKVKEKFFNEKIYLVMGGFHLMDKDRRTVEIILEHFKNLGVIKVGPTHCTGYEARSIFKERYKEAFVQVKTGETFDI